MRRFAGLVLAVVVLAFSTAAAPPSTASFSDNFRNENLNGWWFVPPDFTPN
jgi:hypothetical protein